MTGIYLQALTSKLLMSRCLHVNQDVPNGDGSGEVELLVPSPARPFFLQVESQSRGRSRSTAQYNLNLSRVATASIALFCAEFNSSVAA